MSSDSVSIANLQSWRLMSAHQSYQRLQLYVISRSPRRVEKASALELQRPPLVPFRFLPHYVFQAVVDDAHEGPRLPSCRLAWPEQYLNIVWE